MNDLIQSYLVTSDNCIEFILIRYVADTDTSS
jgi:hypothetical protein